MSNYTPTASDYKFLLENHPEVFADRGAARTVVGQLSTSKDGQTDARLTALANNYKMGGNPPMTRSPIPPAADADGDGNFDPAFAAACVDCKPNQPCCLTGGVIKDFEDPTRKIEWPVKGDKPKTRLLIIAKDVRGPRLCGKIRIEGTGRDCKVGHPRRSLFRVESPVMTPAYAPRSGLDTDVGFDQSINSALALKEFVPEKALLFLMIADTVVSAVNIASGAVGATFTPVQCVNDPSMSQGMQVVPVPYFELAGDASVAVGVHFLTSGIGGNASIEGNLTGKYGALDITGAASASAKPSSGRGRPSGTTAPGLAGTIASIIGNFSESVSQTSPSPDRIVDRTTVGSGVRFDMTLKLAATGVKLEAKKATPDLEAKVGSLETTLTMKASGILDIVDLAAQIMLSPAGARLVQEARSAMANKSNAVRGEVRAEIVISAEGELKHKLESGITVLLPADSSIRSDPQAMTSEFGGKLTVRGTAQILIHVEGEVWIASAEAGAAGTVHTGWIWEMKVGEGKKRQKRYYFEGIKARATGYMRIGAKSSHRRGAPAQDREDRSSSRGVTATQQGPDYSAGDKNWRDPNASRSELDNEGAVYVLVAPTVERVTDTAPPWSDY
ncbi:hypothetical protein [Paracoccus sulfuroxidans]|uniref:Uncharacterized protein n=1 Tax=Paracoccus sulfuroxidans TaxID=384678 RepID=A0A562NNV6_9RHOB|nr:hypothetical protein [Paracoccus sulfuroxidans]TWI33875.1 hypothetical protein IQ24_02242 [Paracoccus sulfuroxidans]